MVKRSRAKNAPRSSAERNQPRGAAREAPVASIDPVGILWRERIEERPATGTFGRLTLALRYPRRREHVLRHVVFEKPGVNGFRSPGCGEVINKTAIHDPGNHDAHEAEVGIAVVVVASLRIVTATGNDHLEAGVRLGCGATPGHVRWIKTARLGQKVAKRHELEIIALFPVVRQVSPNGVI